MSVRARLNQRCVNHVLFNSVSDAGILLKKIRVLPTGVERLKPFDYLLGCYTTELRDTRGR